LPGVGGGISGGSIGGAAISSTIGVVREPASWLALRPHMDDVKGVLKLVGDL
jgi:hypothetical protein